MNDLPLHPSLVHFPIALAVLVPILGALLLLGTRRDDATAHRAFRLPTLAQAAALLFGLAAQRTGDGDHHEVEKFVDRAIIHAHEEAGELFLITAGVTLVLWFAAAAAARVDLGRKVAVAAVVVGIVGGGLALRAGHKGGELVYRYGAAGAYTQDTAEPTPP